MIRGLFVAVATLILSIPSLAKEGFSEQRELLPPPLQRAWNSVFLLHWMSGTSGLTGTAFLVAALPGKNVTDLYFVTSGHNVPANCEATRTCGRLHLIQNARFALGTEGQLDFKVREGLILESVDIALREENPDLALLHARIPKSLAPPPSLRIASQCRLVPGEPLYTTSFSDPSLRTASDRQPIANTEETMKRWSEGKFVNYLHSRVDSLNYVVSGTTVDALKGASGSPLFNAAGDVVGVTQIVATSAAKQYRYVGVESSDSKQSPHSASAPCEYLTLFIDSGIRMQQIRAEIPEA